jgi:hypothetical protein
MEKLIIPSILSVSDVISMSERILNVTLPLTEMDPKFGSLHAQTSSIFARLVKNQKSTTKNSFTDVSILADKDRDCAFICLRDVLHGMSVSLIEEIKSKAAKLYAIIDKYGGQIYKLGYKAESATLLSLLKEFDQPENQQLLSDLGVIMFYGSLKTAEDTFVSVSQQKSEEKTIQTNESEAATMILKEMLPELTKLVSMLQLYSQFDPDNYGTAYSQVITSITEINTIARARKTRKQNNKDDDEKSQQA